MAAQGYHQRIREEKRQGCVRAARELFLAQGYERTSLAEVARAAGLSTATLFKRYPTKAALFAAVVDAFQPEHAGAPAVDTEDARAALAAIGREYAAAMADPAMAAIHRLVIAEAVLFPDLGPMLAERCEAWALARVEAVLARLPAPAGAGRRDASARAFLAIIARAALWPALMQPSRAPDPAEAKAAVALAVAMLLRPDEGATDSRPVPAVVPEDGAPIRPAGVPRREATPRRREAPAREETLSLFAFD